MRAMQKKLGKCISIQFIGKESKTKLPEKDELIGQDVFDTMKLEEKEGTLDRRTMIGSISPVAKGNSNRAIIDDWKKHKNV